VAKFSPLEFVNEVRAETKKVTWPKRKETLMTGVMVMIMTVSLGAFFTAIDSIFDGIVRTLLKLAQ
jgi:preprotein translocase subunit SecE